MADFDIGDIIRVAARLRTADGGDIVNVYHWRVENEVATYDDLEALILAGYDDLYGDIEANIPSDVSFYDIDIKNLTKNVVYPAISWGDLIQGGGTGATAPESCALVVSGGTNATKTVARKFLGPFISSQLNDGVWASGTSSAAAGFLARWLLGFTSVGGTHLAPVVVRLLEGAIDRVVDITSGKVSNAVRNQRRRQRGVGS